MPPTSRGESTAVVPDMALSNTVLTAAPAATSTSPTVTTMAPRDDNGIIQHHTSKVNGLGMWAAWERNFSNKLKACLDLVDNAVDAALWDSDDEYDDSDDDDFDDNDDNNSRSEEGKQSNKKSPLTREEKWKKISGNIQITTERHRLASAAAAAAAGEGGSDNNDDDDDSPPVIVHDILGTYGGKKKSNNNNISGNGNGNGNGNGSDNYDYILDDDNTLCLHNDCVYPVKKLKKILDVYNSDKSDSAIGENGVGVKQAAAAMSDLSIVITTRIDQEPLLEKKKDDGNDGVDGGDIINSNNKDSSSSTPSPRIRKCLVSIGILSKQLQTPGAVVIPNWEIKVEFSVDDNHNAGQKKTGVDSNDNNEEEQKKKGCNNKTDYNGNDGEFTDDQDCRSVLIREIATITAKFTCMGKAMKQFGGAASTNRRMHGIRRLAKHVELMVSSNHKKSNKKSNTKKQKTPHPHQFLMLLHRFGKNEVKKRTNKNKEASDAVSIKARNSLDDLLRDLADELPKTYLHIPPAPYFKIKVNSETLKFQYWERQLVELHRIPLLIDRKSDFRSAEDWLTPTSEDDAYNIQVTIGFDPTRANPLRGGMKRSVGENTFIGGQACSLLIYSRVSGRLFLKHDDARGILRLNNSGTHYCQGLTVIVDDLAGNLPLTPTKESLAFGLEEHGTIHERNLYAWLGALANLYWTHHYNKYKTKGALGEAIKSKVSRVNELEREDATILPSLKDGSFSTVQKVGFSRERIQGSIRPCKSHDIVWINGPDTLIKLGGPARPKPKKKRPKKSTTAATTEKRRLSTTLSVMDGYDSDGNDLMTGKPPSEGEEISSRERLDGRPVRSTTKPQRFDEIHDEHSPRKKRFKIGGNGGKLSQGNGDASLKKKLEEVQSELEGTYAELNASKATCDDLQMLLEEREQTGSVERKRINELKNELDQTEMKHEAELQKIRVEHAKKVDELRA